MCTMTHLLGNNILIYIIYYCYVDIMRIRKRRKEKISRFEVNIFLSKNKIYIQLQMPTITYDL